MPSPDDQPAATDDTDEPAETAGVTDGGDDDPTERADDGMAPFIANTGDDDTSDGDADAATG